jgi:nucleotide-binding universal stress UspA family protein
MAFGRILVGFDDSESSRGALALGSLLARASGAELVVAYAQRPDAGDDPATVLAGAVRWLPYAARPQLRSVRSRSVASGLQRVAVAEQADLIVVGAPARRALTLRHPAGAPVGTRLIHGAPCAVSVAPRDFALDPSPGLRVIGIAFDGGPEAREALTVACELALAAGATVKLIGVAEPAAAAPGVASAAAPLESMGAIHERIRRELEACADGLPPVLRAEVVVSDGRAAAEIAKGAGILSLLVMGSRARGAVSRVLLGSVSAPIVRAAPCPVLVIPRGGGAAAARASSRLDTAARAAQA